MNITFKGRIVIIGCGAVSQCLQYLLAKENLDFNKITLIDALEVPAKKLALLPKGAQFVHVQITKENYKKILKEYLGEGDILIDLSVDINTEALIVWCQRHGVRFVNTSLELWPDENKNAVTIAKKTLYRIHQTLNNHSKDWPKNGPTAVIENGANPGLVSHWTKQTLVTIAEKIIDSSPNSTRKEQLQDALSNKNFPLLGHLTGTKVIHVAERDTQVTDKPKQVNEFVNTWSIYGLVDEATAPSEIGWGTHEKKLPKYSQLPRKGPLNEVFIKHQGMHTFARSWVPSGPIIGMIIRHGEAYTISEFLTLRENKKVIYRPTVHYVYLPSDSTCNSLHELSMNNYKLQPNLRILNDDIIHGQDQLGVLLLGHDFNGWWTGSLLSIEETRQLVPHQNATTLQVAASLLGAISWIINHPNEGLCRPEDLDHEEVLKVANQYLGTLQSVQTDWDPTQYLEDPLKAEKTIVKPENKWQFINFFVR